MINVSNDYKSAIVQPRTIDAKIIVGNNTITSDDINAIKRSFNTTLFKTIAKMVDIDSNTTIAKDTTINPQFGLYINNAFEYVSLGSYKVKDAPILNKDTNSYQITAYDKIIESMVSYELTSSDITYPCTVRQLFVAIFTKLGWATSGIPNSFTNSTSQIEEDVYSNVNMTYRDVLDELCTISCMFLIDVNGTPTLKQKTTTSETINEEFMSDTSVEVGNQVFFNSLVFSRSANSDNIYRKDDTSITNNGLHEFKVSDLQILSLNWRDNFIDAMWNYIKTFTYYAFDINTNGITYLEPIDEFTLSTFGSTYTTLLLNSDLTIANGVNEKIYATEPLESETEYQYADTTDKRINQTTLIVNKQQGEITALVSQVENIEQDIQNPTARASGQYIDIDNALDEPLVDFSMDGDTQQDSTTGKNLLNNTLTSNTYNGITYVVNEDKSVTLKSGTATAVTWLILNSSITLEAGTYTMSSGNTSNTIRMYCGALGGYTSDGIRTKTLTSSQTSDVSINIPNGTSITTPITIYPMIQTGSTATDYEKYSGGIPAPNPSYPQPIQVVTGRNDINVCGKNEFSSELEQGTINGTTGLPSDATTRVRTANYINILPNTQYTLSINETNKLLYVFEYDSNNNFIQRIPSDWHIFPYTFTTSNTTKKIKVLICNNNNTNILPTDVTNKQLEKGSTSSQYEAYTGYTQEINLGKNLLDKDNPNSIASGTTWNPTSNGGTITTTSGFTGGIRWNFKVNKGQKYTFKYKQRNSNDLYIYIRTYTDSTYSTIKTTFVNDGTQTKYTITPDSEYLQVRFDSNVAISDILIEELQLEKGSSASTYSPYFTPIELCKISTYQDYLFYNTPSSIYYNNELQDYKWYIHKEIGKVVLNGSEIYNVFNTNASRTAIETSSISDLETYTSSNDTPRLYCNYFMPMSENATWKPNYLSRITSTTKLYFLVSSGTTTEQFKTWLSTHNTTVYYVLANSTDTEITNEELLGQLNNLMTKPLLKGLNHITNDTANLYPNLNIEYVRDTALNENYVKRPELINYYTKVETIAQIQIGNSSIQQNVAEIQTTLDSNGEAINTISNQVQTLQSSTSLQINAINSQLENGVEKLTNSLVRIDANGINTSKTGETFNTQITNKSFEVKDSNKELVYLGYDNDLKKTVARMDWLESEHATIGTHRVETITKNSKKRTAWFYVGGGN